MYVENRQELGRPHVFPTKERRAGLRWVGMLRNENEITYRFESRFILSDYVAKRQEYSSMPTFPRLVRQAA